MVIEEKHNIESCLTKEEKPIATVSLRLNYTYI